jgi:hypothetical protein
VQGSTSRAGSRQQIQKCRTASTAGSRYSRVVSTRLPRRRAAEIVVVVVYSAQEDCFDGGPAVTYADKQAVAVLAHTPNTYGIHSIQ